MPTHAQPQQPGICAEPQAKAAPPQLHTIPTAGGFPPCDDPAATVALPSNAPHRTPRPPVLDARLRAAADWVAPCGICADIGCDHGRLGTALLLEQRCRHLLAADVSAKALEKAKARLRAQGLAGQTTFAHADGLQALDALPEGKADAICILGMGGETLAGILTHGQSRLQGARLILGAQTDLPTVRGAVQRIGYRLLAERVVAVDRHLYLLMLAAPAIGAEAPYSAAELTLGPCLLRDLPPEWKPWLARRERLLLGAIAAMQRSGIPAAETRHAAALWELALTRDALAQLAQTQ